MTPYATLLSPFDLRGLRLKNRVVHLPTITLYAMGSIETERSVRYLGGRAAGGAGLIVTGNRMIHPSSTVGMPRYSWAFREEMVGRDRKLTEAVHAEGTAIVAQLNHFGASGWSEAADDPRYLMAPAAVRSPVSREIARPMTEADISELREWWKRSARLTYEGGFDGVELHLAHSYLLHSFLSPIYNDRSDVYGGDLTGRLRAAVEIATDVRSVIGNEKVLGIRLSLTDGLEGGLSPEDACVITSALIDTAEIDYVSLTAGGDENLHIQIAPSDIGGWWLADVTRRFKAALKSTVAVVAAGGITLPIEGEEVIRNGVADLVGMSRALLADPEWVKKAGEGQEEEIIPCIRCNQGCIERLYRGFPVSCTVNPVAGREGALGNGRNQGRRVRGERWIVVGAGPAGLTAARGLAMGGAQVQVFERDDDIGGRFRVAATGSGREPFRRLLEYLDVATRSAGVEISRETVVTGEMIGGMDACGVVLATGAGPSQVHRHPSLPELTTLGVGPEIVSGWSVLTGGAPRVGCALVYDTDGTRYASHVTESLLNADIEVVLVTPLERPFPTLLATLEYAPVMERLGRLPFEYYTNTYVQGFTRDEIVLSDVLLHRCREVCADIIVTTFGWESDQALAADLRDQSLKVIEIGDCFAPRRLDHAIYEGFMVGSGFTSRDEWAIAEGSLEV